MHLFSHTHKAEPTGRSVQPLSQYHMQKYLSTHSLSIRAAVTISLSFRLAALARSLKGANADDISLACQLADVLISKAAAMNESFAFPMPLLLFML